MFAHISMLVAAQMFGSLTDAYPNIAPKVAAEHVAACGAGAVTVRSDAQLDTDTLVIAGTAPLSDQQLACIDKAASFYDVELQPPAQARFNAVREARSAALMASEARKWLKTHDLLDRLPVYRPGVTDDVAFGREVETLCNAKGAFRSRYGPHVLSPDWIMSRANESHPDMKPMQCLLAVSAASGFKMGFIGNEQIAPE